MYDISVSIVTYNNSEIIEKTLKELVTHMSNQLSYIIYIIDNDSRDSTIDTVRRINGNIKIIKNSSNIGFGAGHNVILSDLDSKYHIVFNPDITIVNDILYEMYKFMETKTEIGLLSPLIKYESGQIQYLCKKNPTVFDLFVRLVLPGSFKQRQDYYTMMDTGYNKEFDFEYASGSFMFFRTDIFKAVNGFDDNFFMYLEDADITRRVNEISRTVFYPYNFVLHGWQRGAHKNVKLMWINIKSACHYFKKWGIKLF